MKKYQCARNALFVISLKMNLSFSNSFTLNSILPVIMVAFTVGTPSSSVDNGDSHHHKASSSDSSYSKDEATDLPGLLFIVIIFYLELSR